LSTDLSSERGKNIEQKSSGSGCAAGLKTLPVSPPKVESRDTVSGKEKLWEKNGTPRFCRTPSLFLNFMIFLEQKLHKVIKKFHPPVLPDKSFQITAHSIEKLPTFLKAVEIP
jgi:hypothetical protein